MELPQSNEVERFIKAMNNLMRDDRRRNGYGQLAYYAYRAIKVASRDDRREYQKKIGIALCVLDSVGLLDEGDFLLLQDRRYSDTESCFEYVNNKAGKWYEL